MKPEFITLGGSAIPIHKNPFIPLTRIERRDSADHDPGDENCREGGARIVEVLYMMIAGKIYVHPDRWALFEEWITKGQKRLEELKEQRR